MLRLSVFIVVVCALLSSGCSEKKQNKRVVPNVIATPVIEKEIKTSKTRVGQVVPLNSVLIKSRIEGLITEQNASNGSYVKQNDVLYTIQKTQYEANVMFAQGKLEVAQAELANEAIEYNRKKLLADKNAVSKRDYDIATANYGNAKGRLKQAQAELIEAELNLSYTEISAPFNGKLGITECSPGALVTPNDTVLNELVMMDPIAVEFSVGEGDLLNYFQKQYIDKHLLAEPDKYNPSRGVKVQLILANGSVYPTTGKIIYLNNKIDPLIGSIIVRAQFSNPNHMLIPGSYVTVNTLNQTPLKMLLIPQEAVQVDQGGSYVYTVNKNNVVELKSIKTGFVYGTDIIVLEGLTKGEWVIFKGMQKVHDGLTVNPKKVHLKSPENRDDVNTEINPTAASDTQIINKINLNNEKQNSLLEREISLGNKDIDKMYSKIKEDEEKSPLGLK